MEIRENKNVCIIAPICSKLDKYKTQRILERVRKESRHVAIDLGYVKDCTMDFIEGILTCANKDLGIFNIPSDIFVLFNVMNLDKFVKLYVSEMDFETSSRQLINRKFSII